MSNNECRTDKKDATMNCKKITISFRSIIINKLH